MTETSVATDIASGPATVRLADVQRRMTLFAEAISGQSAMLAPVEQLDQHFRPNVFTSDGKHYWLPAWVNEYSDPARNYAYYRVALLHQIGYQLHGTFRFSLIRFGRLFPDLAKSAVAARLQRAAGIRHGPSDLERFLSAQEHPRLSRWLFATIEAWRIDRQNYRQFPGLRADLLRTMADALAGRPPPNSLPASHARMEALVGTTLRSPAGPLAAAALPDSSAWLINPLQAVTREGASVHDSAAATVRLAGILAAHGDLPAMMNLLLETDLAPGSTITPARSDSNAPVSPIRFRGEIFALPALASRRQIGADAMLAATTGGTEAGQDETVSRNRPAAANRTDTDPEDARQLKERYVLVDEWDYLNRQVLRGWCCLREYRLEGSPGTFRSELLARYRDGYGRIKRQFNTLRPEAIRIQRGLPDGETFELDRLIARIADRRAGHPGEDRLYQRRDRAERDVATAFLLDMSASTDFKVPDPLDQDDNHAATEAPASIELDDIGWSPYDAMELAQSSSMRPSRRVIDIARESLGLVSAVLQDLGDRFALYAYSGQGRHHVNFGIAKDFDQACSGQTWGALAAIEPQGSSRMGAPIRHAGAKMSKVAAKVKIMIVISDGYPQDIDYGPDRISDEYGLHDTARAIEEVSRRGIHVFCLSVDLGGHDYLRRLCAPNRYLVIDEVSALPMELMKVYRGLTQTGSSVSSD